MQNKMGQIDATGTLSNSTPLPVSTYAAGFPASVSLTSSYASRLVEFSVDGGMTYFTPAYDVTATTQIVVAVLAPITHVRFTGQANDTYRIQS